MKLKLLFGLLLTVRGFSSEDLFGKHLDRHQDLDPQGTTRYYRFNPYKVNGMRNYHSDSLPSGNDNRPLFIVALPERSSLGVPSKRPRGIVYDSRYINLDRDSINNGLDNKRCIEHLRAAGYDTVLMEERPGIYRTINPKHALVSPKIIEYNREIQNNRPRVFKRPVKKISSLTKPTNLLKKKKFPYRRMQGLGKSKATLELYERARRPNVFGWKRPQQLTTYDKVKEYQRPDDNAEGKIYRKIPYNKLFNPQNYEYNKPFEGNDDDAGKSLRLDKFPKVILPDHRYKAKSYLPIMDPSDIKNIDQPSEPKRIDLLKSISLDSPESDDIVKEYHRSSNQSESDDQESKFSDEDPKDIFELENNKTTLLHSGQNDLSEAVKKPNVSGRPAIYEIGNQQANTEPPSKVEQGNSNSHILELDEIFNNNNQQQKSVNLENNDETTYWNPEHLPTHNNHIDEDKYTQNKTEYSSKFYETPSKAETSQDIFSDQQLDLPQPMEHHLNNTNEELGSESYNLSRQDDTGFKDLHKKQKPYIKIDINTKHSEIKGKNNKPNNSDRYVKKDEVIDKNFDAKEPFKYSSGFESEENNLNGNLNKLNAITEVPNSDLTYNDDVLQNIGLNFTNDVYNSKELNQISEVNHDNFATKSRRPEIKVTINTINHDEYLSKSEKNSFMDSSHLKDDKQLIYDSQNELYNQTKEDDHFLDANEQNDKTYEGTNIPDNIKYDVSSTNDAMDYSHHHFVQGQFVDYNKNKRLNETISAESMAEDRKSLDLDDHEPVYNGKYAFVEGQYVPLEQRTYNDTQLNEDENKYESLLGLGKNSISKYGDNSVENLYHNDNELSEIINSASDNHTAENVNTGEKELYKNSSSLEIAGGSEVEILDNRNGTYFNSSDINENGTIINKDKRHFIGFITDINDDSKETTHRDSKYFSREANIHQNTFIKNYNDELLMNNINNVPLVGSNEEEVIVPYHADLSAPGWLNFQKPPALNLVHDRSDVTRPNYEYNPDELLHSIGSGQQNAPKHNYHDEMIDSSETDTMTVEEFKKKKSGADMTEGHIYYDPNNDASQEIFNFDDIGDPIGYSQHSFQGKENVNSYRPSKYIEDEANDLIIDNHKISSTGEHDAAISHEESEVNENSSYNSGNPIKKVIQSILEDSITKNLNNQRKIDTIEAEDSSSNEELDGIAKSNHRAGDNVMIDEIRKLSDSFNEHNINVEPTEYDLSYPVKSLKFNNEDSQVEKSSETEDTSKIKLNQHKFQTVLSDDNEVRTNISSNLEDITNYHVECINCDDKVANKSRKSRRICFELDGNNISENDIVYNLYKFLLDKTSQFHSEKSGDRSISTIKDDSKEVGSTNDSKPNNIFNLITQYLNMTKTQQRSAPDDLNVDIGDVVHDVGSFERNVKSIEDVAEHSSEKKEISHKLFRRNKISSPNEAEPLDQYASNSQSQQLLTLEEDPDQAGINRNTRLRNS